MRANRVWQGVRMRRVEAGVDPDAPARTVGLPAAWEPGAARGLAGLVEGGGPVDLRVAAEAWIRPLGEPAADSALLPLWRGTEEPREMLGLADRLHAMLLHRQGAPARAVWNGRAADDPRFVLNLAGFLDPACGFDADAFALAAEAAVLALGMAVPEPCRVEVGVADLAGLLAGIGLDYATEAARGAARSVASLLRERAAATVATYGVRHRVDLVIRGPAEAEALLGVETGGIAPAFSPLSDDGRLTRTAQAWLAARGMTAEAALSATLAGETVFPEATADAHRAMYDALAPFFTAMPPRPEETLNLAIAPVRRELPTRRAGYTQKASVGGHRVFVRTGEYADGTLGEVSVALPRDSAGMRGLMDGLTAAVSLGLQHGVPLAEFVESLTLTRFGPAGAVEGDPAVAQASSVLDYVFRHLAANYLPGTALPAPPLEPEIADPPSLPLDLPADPRARRRGFRVIAG